MNRSIAIASLIGVIILNLSIFCAAQDPVYSLNCTSSKQTFDPVQKKCVSCPEQCEDCAWSFAGNGVTCTRCPNNFFYKIEKNIATCTACATNCRKCRGPDADDCIEATDSYMRYNLDKKQLIKCEDSNCQSCDETGVCQVCEPRYLLEDKAGKKVCTSCPGSCGVCARLSDQLVCQECTSGYRLTMDRTPSCTNCGSYCAVCNGANMCLMCNEDYLIFNGQCYSMSNCLTIKDEKNCGTCKPGYFLDAGKCTRCDDGCAECTAKGVCTKCQDEYSLNDKVCTKCPSSCSTCDATGLCTQCKPKYYATPDKKSCKSGCPSYCDVCSDDKTCTKCSNDGVMIGTECKSVSSVCSKSGEGVKELTGQGTCASYLDNANLLFCSRADLTTTPARCVDTIDSKYIFDTKNGKVVNCPTGCKTCQMTPEGGITCPATRLADYLTIAADPTTKTATLSAGCPKGCATCDDDLTNCKDCTIGYRLHISILTGVAVCVTKDAPCSYPVSDKKCYTDPANVRPAPATVLAGQGEYYDPVKNMVVKCGAGCDLCAWNILKKQETCLQAKMNDGGRWGLALIDGIGVPQKCVANCYVCKGNATDADCLQWTGDWKYNPVTKAVSQCGASYCRYCDEKGVCQRCMPQAGLAQNNTCQSCSSNCGECIYARVNNSDVRACTKCNSGYYLNDGECTKCTQANCALCTGPTKCLACDSSSILTPIGQCVEKSRLTNCKTLAYDSASCTSCDPGYYLDNKRCSSCSDTGCATCSGSGSDKCQACSKGYYLKDQKTCGRCDSNCDACPDNNTCTTCSDGYYLNDKKGCSKCAVGCATCSEDLTCLTCQTGFILADNKRCNAPRTCQLGQALNSKGQCVSGTLQYCQLENADTKTCTIPAPGYYVDPVTKVPANCPVGCGECQSDGKIVTCLKIYIANTSQPVLSIKKKAGESDTVDYYPCAGCAWQAMPSTPAQCAPGFLSFSSLTAPATFGCYPYNQGCVAPSTSGQNCLMMPYGGGYTQASAQCGEKSYADGQTCVPCAKGCKFCRYEPTTKGSTCLQPDDQYYYIALDEKGVGVPKDCIKNCVNCKGPEDRDCLQYNSSATWDMSYNPILSKWEKCSAYNCAQCGVAPVACAKCVLGTQLTLAGKCESCRSSYALKCTINKNISEECSAEYTMVKDSNYVDCRSCYGSGCLTCLTNKEGDCQACRYGYQLFNGKCYSMNSNCLRMLKPEGKDAPKCEVCRNGYYVNQTSGYCSSCGYSSNCGACNDKGCLEPATGFYLTAEQKTEACLMGCNVCKDAKTCQSCATGWTKTAGDAPTCQKCADPFCENCEGNFQICKRCRANYLLSTDNKTCIGLESCPVGTAVQDDGSCVDLNLDYCIRGDYRGGKKICAVTTPGWYFDTTTGTPTSGKLIACPARCYTCALNAAGELKCLTTKALDGNATRGFYLVPVFDKDKKQDVVDYKCPDGCKKCTQDGKTCLECIRGYRPAISNKLPTSTILRCVANGETCKARSTQTSSDGCFDEIGDNTPETESSDMKNGGYYDDNEKAGKACPDGCLECNWHFVAKKPNCLKARLGFALVFDAMVGTATKCAEGCDACKGVASDADCLSWSSAWTYNPVDKKKYKAPSYCILASADNVCAKCQEGYGVFEGSCRSCSGVCGECLFYKIADSVRSQCIRCQTGSYFDITSGSCQTCKAECTSCTSKDSCLSCKNPLTRAVNGVCTYFNCLETTATGSCSKCKPGFYSDPGSICAACPPGCNTCKSATECLDCQSGYVMSGTTCKACSTPVGECQTCAADLKCTACNTALGVTLQVDKCMRVNVCPDGQYPLANGACGSSPFCKFGTDVASDCRVPEGGYYLDGTQLKNCPAGCSKCYKSGELIKCLAVSQTNPMLPTYSIIPGTNASDSVRFNCPVGCASCDAQGCLSCATGYSLSYALNLASPTWPAATCMANNDLSSCVRFGEMKSCITAPGVFGEISKTMAPCGAGAYPTADGCKQCTAGCIDCGLNLATMLDTCYQPRVGYYLQTTTTGSAVPKKCADGCNICVGSESRDCTRWQDSSLTWEPADQVYAKCGANCDYCTAKGVCTACRPGYADPVGGKCEKACTESNCAQCKPETTCSKCRLGYSLQGSKCQLCQDTNCGICADVKKCDFCKPGYVVTAKGTCVSPRANCITMNEDGSKCTKCMQGFYIWSSTSCSSCMSNCANCNDDNSKCITPATGYWLKADRPAICGSGCIACQDDKTCTTCRSGQRLKDDKTCEACKVSGCDKCEKGADTCTACLGDSWPSADGKTCVSARSCPPGQGIQDDGTCTQIKWPNARLCLYADLRTGKTNCVVSAPGYVFNPSKNDMTNCPARCKSCALDTNRRIVCNSIMRAEGLSGASGNNLVAVPNLITNADDVLYNCPTGCDTCDLTGTICSSCKQGFESAIVFNMAGIRCAEKKDGCSTYDLNNKCYVDPNYKGPIDVSALPKAGQFFDGTGTQTCPSNCAECSRVIGTTSPTCTSCKPGYVLTATTDGKAQTCTQCAAGCNRCVGPAANQCLDLLSGRCWSNTQNRIVTCDANCILASNDNICTICKEGWMVQSNACVRIQTTGCAVNVNNRCIKCFNDNWLKDDGTCQRCTDPVNCHACVRNGQCFICKNSTGITRSVTGSGCVACSENCDSCDSANTCKQCNPFTSKDGAGKCQACPEYCTDCQGATCKTCLEGLDSFGVVKAGDKCIACPLSCKTCTQSGETATCQACMAGFVLNGKGECEPCGRGCSECDTNKCNKCSPNGIPTDNVKECKLPSDCRPTWGLNLDEAGRCAPIGIPFCLMGSFSKTKKDCFKTVDGYYWDGANMQNCPQGCAACSYDQTAKYITCTRVSGEPGAFSVQPQAKGQDVLVGCTEGCATCTMKEPSACLTCLSGFRIHESFFGGSYCRRIEIACSFPDYGGNCFTDQKSWVKIGSASGLIVNIMAILAAVTFFLW